MRAVVVGAGIGGLTSALCLCRRGIIVDVFEQADAVHEFGVGISILHRPSLAELGLLAEVDAVAVRTRTLIMTTRRGQSILHDPRGIDAGWPVPQFSIHCGHLQRVLHDALRRSAGREVVHVDHRLVRFEPDDGSARVRFVDRTGACHGEVDGNVLIGTDGIHSLVRAQLVPGEGEPVERVDPVAWGDGLAGVPRRRLRRRSIA